MANKWLVTIETTDKEGNKSVMYQDDDDTIYINRYRDSITKKCMIDFRVGKEYKPLTIKRSHISTLLSNLEDYFDIVED